MQMTMTNWTRKVFLRRLSTKLSHIACSRMSYSVSLVISHCCMWNLNTNLVTALQQEQPQLYDSLTKILTSEEQQIIQSVFQEADKASAAAAAGLANGGNLL